MLRRFQQGAGSGPGFVGGIPGRVSAPRSAACHARIRTVASPPALGPAGVGHCSSLILLQRPETASRRAVLVQLSRTTVEPVAIDPGFPEDDTYIGAFAATSRRSIPNGAQPRDCCAPTRFDVSRKQKLKARRSPQSADVHSITTVTVFEAVPAAVTTTSTSPLPARLRGSAPVTT